VVKSYVLYIQVWLSPSEIPAFGRLRQKDQELEAILHCVARPCLKKREREREREK
jgi:hypothetical protein